MTLEQAQSLTDDEIRVRVAEIVGYQLLPSNNPKQLTWQMGKCTVTLPNYPADLNACADMEKVLHSKAHPSALTELETKYRDRLAAIMGCAWYQSAKLLRASARARCEAFVTVMGKDTP